MPCNDACFDAGQDSSPSPGRTFCDDGLRVVFSNYLKGRVWPVGSSLPNYAASVPAIFSKIHLQATGWDTTVHVNATHASWDALIFAN